MTRSAIFTILLGAALGATGGCQFFPFVTDAGPGADVAPGTAALTLSMDPNPLQEGVCEACGAGQLASGGTLTITETNGVAVNITEIDVSQSSDNGPQASGSYSASQVEAAAGSDEVAADGSLVMPGVGLYYDESLGFVPAVFTVAVQATDTNGHTVSASLAVQVIPD